MEQRKKQSVFRFQQFSIRQDRCAMKVGTDGVLLGAWAQWENEPGAILDIGAGTGLLALMLAQRSETETIDALEIDVAAFEQCVDNFEASPWANRLFCYHVSLQEFMEEVYEQYDLIVSNPPFFSETVSSGSEGRDHARQNSSLPFDYLLQGISRLLLPDGVFHTIVPYREEVHFLDLARSYSLYPGRITRVRGNPTAPLKRSLLELSFRNGNPEIGELVIEKARHVYTREYRELTTGFYLDF